MFSNILFSIAKKEFMDNIRNKWVLILSVIFAILTIVFSLFGSIFGTGWQDIQGTVSSMIAIVQIFIPIIAIILGYSAIIGEIERGSMSSLLALPTTRLEVLVGKLFGLGSILAVSILIGFGIAGVIIAVNIPNPDIVGFLIFIGATILLGLVFLSMALFFSTLFKKRSSAIGGAIFLWILFIMIIPMIVQGLLIAEVGIEPLMTGEKVQIPDWYYGAQLVDPGSVYNSLIALTIGSMSTPGNPLQITYPSYYSSGLMTLIFIIWIAIFFVLAYWRFSKKDI
ncbi:MAG: ABC transporter permease subunit [Euryarchaeota archaeon]|nr:ABC transporter permease subunit [Euryarchaeota archaeon]